MAAPEFNVESGTYELYFEENLVKIIVDRIQETSRGDVSSFIEVTTTKPGYSPHLNYSKFTLTTTGQENHLLNTCKILWHLMTIPGSHT